MASMEDFEINSLHSVDIPLPNAVNDTLTPPPTITQADSPRTTPSVDHLTSAGRSTASTGQATLQIPTFQLHVEDCDATVEGGGGGTGERPRSVRSFLHRPLSALSRATSALSVRSSTIRNLPASMKALVQRFADRARGRHFSNDDRSDTSSITDPEASIHSGSIKKKLESLAGSEYEYNEHDKKRRRRLKCPTPNCSRLTCNYYIDPHGKMVLRCDTMVMIGVDLRLNIQSSILHMKVYDVTLDLASELALV